MRRPALVALSMLLLGAACDKPQISQKQHMDWAAALADGDSLAVWPARDANRPVVLYVDRSQSMRGFLDTAYFARTRTDYRSVLDGFVARVHPARLFGFGSAVEAASGGLRVLGDKDFYTDGNTQMEDVFPLIAGDTALASSHVIIGDGRRTDPDVAIGQYVEMRELAEAWIDRGGTLVVATSDAPFEPVREDPSGCRAGASTGRKACPLYAFAFVAPGDQGRMTEALAANFEHLFVTPLPALPDTIRLSPAAPAGGSPGLSLTSAWTRAAAGGTRIARVRGTAVNTSQPLRAEVVMIDTVSERMRAMGQALGGTGLVSSLAVRRLDENPAAAPWGASTGAGTLLRPTDDALAFEFFSHGPSADPLLYRIELHATGKPAWLGDFDAEQASDARRTFGLGRLFTGFGARDALRTPPVARLYVVVN